MANSNSVISNRRNCASPHSGSGAPPIFSYTVRCSKQCIARRCSSAPHVQMVRLPPAPSCRVLSSRKRSLSTPLSNFVYDFTQKAYSNREGYTWTPMYLQHCSKPYASTQIIDQVRGRVDPREFKRKSFNYLTLPTADCERRKRVAGKPQEGSSRSRRQFTGYSKFMESPYMKRCMNSKLIDQYTV